MGLEIERKFLVTGESWQGQAEGKPLVQGYICQEDKKVVRARIAGAQAWLTIKGPSVGSARPEFEYEIPVSDAQELIDKFAAGRLVEKTRYKISVGGHIWDFDVFSGANEPLILAEVELSTVDESFERPDWLGDEVTSDGRYANAYLAAHPYSTWK